MSKIWNIAAASALCVSSAAMAQGQWGNIFDGYQSDTRWRVDTALQSPQVTPRFSDDSAWFSVKNWENTVQIWVESINDAPIVGVEYAYDGKTFWALVTLKSGKWHTSVFVSGMYKWQNLWLKTTVWMLEKDVEWKTFKQVFFGVEAQARLTEVVSIWVYANHTKTESWIIKSWSESKRVPWWTEVTDYETRFHWYGNTAWWASFEYTPNDYNKFTAHVWVAKSKTTWTEFWAWIKHLTPDRKTQFDGKYDWTISSGNSYHSLSAGVARKVWDCSELSLRWWHNRRNGRGENFASINFKVNLGCKWPNRFPSFKQSSISMDPYSHAKGADYAATNLYWETETMVTARKFIPDVVPNQAPTANNDTVSTAYNTAVSWNVLTNDTDPDWDTLTVISNTNPTNGTVTIWTNGNYTYTPNSWFSWVDSFTYTIYDGKGWTATGILTVNVIPAPAPTWSNIPNITEWDDWWKNFTRDFSPYVANASGWTFSATGLPTWLTINPTTWVVTWYFDADPTEAYRDWNSNVFSNIVITYTKGWNTYSSNPFTWDIEDDW